MGLTKPIILFLIIFFARINQLHGQDLHWYLIYSPLFESESQSKNTIEVLQDIHTGTEAWYNGSKSHTYGIKSVTPIDWVSSATLLNELGYYLAEITNDRNHREDEAAITSIYFQQALYYGTHTQEMPEDFIAELIDDEWEMLPENVQSIYLDNGNYLIIEE